MDHRGRRMRLCVGLLGPGLAEPRGDLLTLHQQCLNQLPREGIEPSYQVGHLRSLDTPTLNFFQTPAVTYSNSPVLAS